MVAVGNSSSPGHPLIALQNNARYPFNVLLRGPEAAIEEKIDASSQSEITLPSGEYAPLVRSQNDSDVGPFLGIIKVDGHTYRQIFVVASLNGR